MAPPSSNARVAQLPKFAVVQVMIDLNGRECLSSDQWEIKDVSCGGIVIYFQWRVLGILASCTLPFE
jgi:hypothetical protein